MSVAGTHPQLTKEQKTGFILLLFFAVATVVLGFFQLRNTIYSPFVQKPSEDANVLATIEDDAVRLQRIDTDQDALSDYDELNFYQTSPYLADTDSDGKTDKQEIDAGKNPLCAEGKVCEEEETPESSVGQELLKNSAQVTPDQLLGLPAAGTSGQTSGESELDVEALISDPTALRSYLTQTGQVSAEDLEKIDDQQLVDTFKEAYEKTKQQESPSESPVIPTP